MSRSDPGPSRTGPNRKSSVLARAAHLLLATGLALALAACGSGATEPPFSGLAGTASTKTAGPIAGATVELIFYGDGPTANELGAIRALATTSKDGAFRFESPADGWYAVEISWSVEGTITRDHSAVESHADFVVSHYVNGTAMAQSPRFQFPATASLAFVYDN